MMPYVFLLLANTNCLVTQEVSGLTGLILRDGPSALLRDEEETPHGEERAKPASRTTRPRRRPLFLELGEETRQRRDLLPAIAFAHRLDAEIAEIAVEDSLALLGERR